MLDAEWLESLYDPSMLVEGKEVLLPWRGKGGTYQEWSAVLVCPTAKPEKRKGEKRKGEINLLVKLHVCMQIYTLKLQH